MDLRSFVPAVFCGTLAVLIVSCGENRALIVPSSQEAFDTKTSSNPCLNPISREKKYTHVLTFQYKGQEQAWTVPSKLTSAFVIAIGAEGSSGFSPGTPGYGGCIASTVRVGGIKQLGVYVGGKGKGCVGGFNGGGSGHGDGGHQGICGGGGGGASGLTGQGHGHGGYLIIAGGGGGASEGAPGGAGSYNKGQDGGSDCNTTQCFSTGGKGGSNHRGGGSGGAGQGPTGTGSCDYGSGTSGSELEGGGGGYITYGCGSSGAGHGGAGGGGGFYGGGGGGADAHSGSAGGGGTSAAFGHRFGTIYSARGISEGDGSVIICWN